MQKRICFFKKKIQNTNIIYDKKKLYQECLKIIFTQLKQMNKSKSLKNFKLRALVCAKDQIKYEQNIKKWERKEKTDDVLLPGKHAGK